MKLTILTLFGALTLGAAQAHASPSYLCTGKKGDAAVEIDFYQGGYAYDATYAYFLDGKNVSSGYAHGGSFSECGSRTIPCKEITNTQFTVENPSLIFTMITSLGSDQGHASLSFYENGFSGDDKSVELSCKIEQQ